ncbi:putative aminoacyltransferase, E1 ubiquitin-activating enzyme [Rosa chinensis]|uniref:RING-type E3 ubiquitin transferase n=1 Tax=Rosa chinensis TaxID=74649 RepID=A0A2P6RJM3_ROSCH|nr:E3 ubiquitin-protein ligase RING1 [Rosa chinensis]PRQ46638.1 putative aminoacyltransferase, E1 ubiquitin-activating enzyme [Rosa chinensis]
MHQWRHVTETDGPLRWGMKGRNSHDILSNFDDPDMMPYVTNSGDYLDALGFEELLEHLAQAERLRLGAPPAAVSFLNNLPLILISKEHGKHDDLACAICKDVLTISTAMNRLPCFHLYHTSCILPWLSTRNSCPLCRYKIPADDRDYEEGKRNAGGRVEIHTRRQNARDDRSAGVFNRAEEGEDHAFSETRVKYRFQVGRESDSNTSGGENSQ